MNKYIIFSIFLIACRPATSGPAFRDIVLKRYSHTVDSAGWYNSGILDRELLNAYASNDTTSLRNIDNIVSKKISERPYWELWKEDIPLPELKTISNSEGYRFVFTINGNYFEAITIFEKDSTAWLHHACWIQNRHEPSRVKLSNVFEWSIPESSWNTLKEKLRDADFWALEPESKHRGDDGSDLTVIGFQKKGNLRQNHQVHRWSGATLTEAFHFVYFTLLPGQHRCIPWGSSQLE